VMDGWISLLLNINSNNSKVTREFCNNYFCIRCCNNNYDKTYTKKPHKLLKKKLLDVFFLVIILWCNSLNQTFSGIVNLLSMIC